MTNPSARAYVRSLPYAANYEANYSDGMPLFVNSRKSTPGCPSVCTATTAVINYFLEQGARKLYQAQLTSHKRKRGDLLNEYNSIDYLSPGTVQEFVDSWRYFGYIYSIQGKGSESGLPGAQSHGEEHVFNCTVSKTADIVNYWGVVSDGDYLGWTLGMKRNVYDYFYDPDGAIVGDSRGSPEFFLQLVPVNFGRAGHAPSHNRQWADLDQPHRDDIDFVYKNFEVIQQDLDMNMETGEFTPKELDLSAEHIKTRKLITDIYAHGLYIPVGMVNKGSRTKVRSNQRESNLSLRSNPKAQTLGKIQVFLGS
jgi:hypothetical protein